MRGRLQRLLDRVMLVYSFLRLFIITRKKLFLFRVHTQMSAYSRQTLGPTKNNNESNRFQGNEKKREPRFSC